MKSRVKVTESVHGNLEKKFNKKIYMVGIDLLHAR